MQLRYWVDHVADQIHKYPHWSKACEDSFRGVTQAMHAVSEELGELYELLGLEEGRPGKPPATLGEWMDELGDLWWTLGALTYFLGLEHQFTIDDVLKRNVKKLKGRYDDAGDV